MIKAFEKDIVTLKLNSSINFKLKELDINTVDNLWKTKRTYLKQNGLSNSEIYQVKIKLQLLGIDLNNRFYTDN